MIPSSKPPETFKQILQEISSPKSIPRPPTPQSLRPFTLVYDPLTLRIYSTIPPVPLPTSQQSFSLTPKRNVKRDLWPRDHATEIHSHILRLREQYNLSTRKVREFTAKTTNFFFFRTLVASEDRTWDQFAEGWYIVKSGQVGQGGLGRGDDAGGLEDIARTGRVKCREIWKVMNVRYDVDSDEE
jgi:hypothetical protein